MTNVVKLARTLADIVRFDREDPEGRYVDIEIPGWRDETVSFFLYQEDNRLPEEVGRLVGSHKFPIAVLVHCNLDADSVSELGLKILGLAPDPVSEDDLN